MRKLAISLGVLLVISFGANAKHYAKVKIEKVFVNMGVPERKVHDMMGCLLCLKKHATKEEALTEKMAMVQKKCEELGLDDKKCKYLKMKKAKKVHNCYMMKEFVTEFFGKAATPEPVAMPEEGPKTGPQ